MGGWWGRGGIEMVEHSCVTHTCNITKQLAMSLWPWDRVYMAYVRII